MTVAQPSLCLSKQIIALALLYLPTLKFKARTMSSASRLQEENVVRLRICCRFHKLLTLLVFPAFV